MATWNIVNLDRNTADGFVTTAHWTVSDVDGEFSGSVYGSVGFSGDLSIPYADLTEAVVVGWVKEALGAEIVAAHEAAVAAQIEAQKNPVSATGLPWVSGE
jgi:hypothetical protein